MGGSGPVHPSVNAFKVWNGSPRSHLNCIPNRRSSRCWRLLQRVKTLRRRLPAGMTATSQLEGYRTYTGQGAVLVFLRKHELADFKLNSIG
ncbi:hypothetical protein BC828DRAFT_407955 [Blastocladiella britannica]|nr:hypothetical protein BC828DRAFT_407955 [Blastocladiella britannica]